MKIHVIIPAGGKGIRSGSSTPKQYLKVLGKELIFYLLETLEQCKAIDDITIAAEKKYHKKISSIIKKYNFTKIYCLVEGGKERQFSVYNALLSLNAEDDDLIVVHDAARPLLPLQTLNQAIKTATQKGNAVVALGAKDTIMIGDKTVKNYLDREVVFTVQTPQIFSYKILLAAIENAIKKKILGTDESTLVHKLGKKIFISEGSAFNFKVTTGDDINIVKGIISQFKK